MLLETKFHDKKTMVHKNLKIMYFHWALISAFIYFKYSPPSLWEQTPFSAVVSLSGWKFEINAGGN